MSKSNDATHDAQHTKASEHMTHDAQCTRCKRTHVNAHTTHIHTYSRSARTRTTHTLANARDTRRRIALGPRIALVFTLAMGDVCAACCYALAEAGDKRVNDAMLALACAHERALSAVMGVDDHTHEMWAFM